MDFESDVLTPLRGSLEAGGPKARAWANVKSSPYSAIAISAFAPNNAFGQCGGTAGLGGPVVAVKAAWAKYKTADKECSSTCGCESKGVKYCNHDTRGLTCELCSQYQMFAECNYAGLTVAGINSCKKFCFSACHRTMQSTHAFMAVHLCMTTTPCYTSQGLVETGCRVFDQWLASKGGDYATAIAQVRKQVVSPEANLKNR